MPKTVSKKTIAVDVDDVLASNAAGFVQFSNQRWGTTLEPQDYHEHWAEMWGIDHEEMQKRRAEIIKAKLFTSYDFLDDAKRVLTKLSGDYRLVILTSRTTDISEDTTAWIKGYFGDLFADIHYAGIWEKLNRNEAKVEDVIKVTKGQIAKDIGADYLIDDQPKHCLAAAKVGITSLLFGDYRWNRDFELLPNMARVKNWQEVLEYFDAAA
jgi:5'(3')-deoxyribonucleotidase